MSADSYAATIQQLSTRIEERRRDLEREREAHENQCTRLRTLYDTMRSKTGVFDEEDCQQVQAQITARQERMEVLRDRAREQEQQRLEQERLYAAMYAVIDARAQVLEHDENCLNANPQMLQFFARKQMNLRRLLQEKMEEALGGTVSPRTNTD